MKHMSDNDTRFPEHYLSHQHIRLFLATALLFIVAGCTSTTTPIPTDQTTQKNTKAPTQKSVDKKTEPQPPTMTNDTSSNQEKTPSTSSSQESSETLAKGEGLYQEHCASCHGANGDGQGKVASDLSTKPRNFTKGIYKFRSTPSGEFADRRGFNFGLLLLGIPGTAMEGFQELPQADLLALVAYLKTFSPRFLKRRPGTPIIVPSPRPLTPEATTRGQHVYREMFCAACHGGEGTRKWRVGPRPDRYEWRSHSAGKPDHGEIEKAAKDLKRSIGRL